MTCRNRLSAAVTAAALAATVVMPLAASAQVRDRQPRLEAKTGASIAAKGFCARLLAAGADVKPSARLTDRQEKLRVRRAEVAAFVASRRNNRVEALTQSRSRLEERRDAVLAKMTELAATPEKQAAVEKYQAAVEAAGVARKAAVDAAVKAFRDGLDQARADRQTSIDAAVSAFAAAVKVAEDKAKADCGVDNADAEQVRAAMKASVEAARTTLRQSIKTANEVGEATPALAKTRQEAFAKALADYKTALEKARAEFKAIAAAN